MKFSGYLQSFGKLRKAKSSDVLGGESKQSQRRISLGTYGQQREVVVDGKAIREIEVTGQKQEDVIEEHRRNRKMSKRKTFDAIDVKVSCRDLSPADYEGWLYKKAGGTGITPVSWKHVWVVLKNGSLYLFKTSFDIIALHVYQMRNFSVAPLPEEKRKFSFKLVPKNLPSESVPLQEIKGVVFAAYSDEEVEHWCDVLNKAALGFIIQPTKPALVPTDSQERRRCYSGATNLNKSNKRNEKLDVNESSQRLRSQSAFFKRKSPFAGQDGETTAYPTTLYPVTALPSSFIRTSSQSRQRKISKSTSQSSVLAVGTMFDEVDQPSKEGTDANTTTEDIASLLYTEKEVEIEVDDEGVTKYTMKDDDDQKKTSEEEEILRKLEVKKEIQRINKQAKVGGSKQENAETIGQGIEETSSRQQTDKNDNEIIDSERLVSSPAVTGIEYNANELSAVKKLCDGEKDVVELFPNKSVPQLGDETRNDTADNDPFQETSFNVMRRRKNAAVTDNTRGDEAIPVQMPSRERPEAAIGQEPNVNPSAEYMYRPEVRQWQGRREENKGELIARKDAEEERETSTTIDPLSKDLVKSIKESLANDDLDYTSDDDQVSTDLIKDQKRTTDSVDITGPQNIEASTAHAPTASIKSSLALKDLSEAPQEPNASIETHKLSETTPQQSHSAVRAHNTPESSLIECFSETEYKLKAFDQNSKEPEISTKMVKPKVTELKECKDVKDVDETELDKAVEILSAFDIKGDQQSHCGQKNVTEEQITDSVSSGEIRHEKIKYEEQKQSNDSYQEKHLEVLPSISATMEHQHLSVASSSIPVVQSDLESLTVESCV